MPIAEAPQTNRMHAVPQNIMDVEFKLIGDLTLRQFMYLFVFGGAAYVSTVVMVGLFKWPTVLLFALLGIGLAFVPIQERGLDEWIVNFVRSVYSPTQRIWRRETSVPSAFMTDNLAVVRQELITLAPTSSRRKLEEYLEYQLADTTEDPLDIPEREYMLKVREAYGDITPSVPSPSVGVGVLEPEAPVFDAYPPSAGFVGQPPSQDETPVELGQEQPQTTPTDQQTAPSDATQAAPPVVAVTTESAAPQTAPVQQTIQTNAPPTPAHIQNKHHHKQKHRSVGLSPLTPDRHSGRRFINLVPASGDLILPIRGERMIKTSEEIEVESDIQGKAEKLQQLLAQIKKESGVISMPQTPPVVQPAAQSPAVDQEAASLAQKLQGEQERLSEEISKLESQKSTATSPTDINEKDSLIQRLKVEKERTQSDYEVLQRQILDLQDKLKQKDDNSTTSQTVNYPGQPPVQVTGKANVINGSVRSKTGTTKEGVLLIIKNQKGEAVRAVKTDSLGHFKLSTPLANGVYTIEVTGDDIGSTFDIITFEAKGESIPPIEIFGK